MTRRRRAPSAALLVAGVLAFAGTTSAASPPAVDETPRFTAPPPAVWDRAGGPSPAAVADGVRTIPRFADSFVFDGRTYDYQMVGTNPRTSNETTVVPVVVVPIRFVFAGRRRFDPGRTTAQMRRSPLFRAAAVGGETTQYGDAVQRAEFWSSVQQNTNWHVLLDQPAVTRTATVKISRANGSVVQSVRGGLFGLIDDAYFAQHVVPHLINGMHLPPTKLIVFWSNGVALKPSTGDGVILGEHSAGGDRAGTTVWTWAWASWRTADSVPAADTDVAALSHEIAEWLNNPFVTNQTPAWSAGGYPCGCALEVGDPLVGTTMVIDGFHLQDEAFLPWFARETPSSSRDGRYSLFGTFTAPPPVCVATCP